MNTYEVSRINHPDYPEFYLVTVNGVSGADQPCIVLSPELSHVKADRCESWVS